MQVAEYKFTKRLYWPQLHFDKYLKTVRKIDPQVFYSMRNQQANLAQFVQAKGEDVDFMRISINVARNLALQQENE